MSFDLYPPRIPEEIKMLFREEASTRPIAFNHDPDFMVSHGFDLTDWGIYWKFYHRAEKARREAKVGIFMSHDQLFAWFIGNVAETDEIEEFNTMQSRRDYRQQQRKGVSHE